MELKEIKNWSVGIGIALVTLLLLYVVALMTKNIYIGFGCGFIIAFIGSAFSLRLGGRKAQISNLAILFLALIMVVVFG